MILLLFELVSFSVAVTSCARVPAFDVTEKVDFKDSFGFYFAHYCVWTFNICAGSVAVVGTVLCVCSQNLVGVFHAVTDLLFFSLQKGGR